MSYPNKILTKDTDKSLITLCFEYMQWNKYHATKTKGLMLYVYEQRDETPIAKKMKHECIFPRDWCLCTEMAYLITSLYG